MMARFSPHAVNPANPIYERLQARLTAGQPILLDGGIGTELVRRGVRWRKHGLLTDADAVEQLHAEYLAAGSDVIRTNTFQLNPRIYLNVFRSREHMGHIGAPGLENLTPKLLRKSVSLARRARTRAGREGQAAIAGVLSPLEHCFRPDLSPPFEVARREHEEISRVLADEGVDFFILESMNTIAEARAALEAGHAAGLPVWVSFVLGPEGELLSREPLQQACAEMERGGASAVLVNCAPPGDIRDAIAKLKLSARLPLGGFAHIGRFSPPSWKFEFFPQFTGTEECPPAQFAAWATRWREKGAVILGGCCGTGPTHIAALRARLDTNTRGAPA